MQVPPILACGVHAGFRPALSDNLLENFELVFRANRDLFYTPKSVPIKVGPVGNRDWPFAVTDARLRIVQPVRPASARPEDDPTRQIFLRSKQVTNAILATLDCAADH